MISLIEITPSQMLLRLLSTDKGLNDMTEKTDYLTPDEKLENLITDFKDDVQKFVKAKGDEKTERKLKPRMTPKEWDESNLD